MDKDVTYYRRRLAEENAAAVAAGDHRVRAVHIELSRRYAERIQALEAERAPSVLHLVTAA